MRKNVRTGVVQERILNKKKNINQGCWSSTQMYNYASTRPQTGQPDQVLPAVRPLLALHALHLQGLRH